MRLDGRTALVVGGAGGLGASVADLFAEVGCRVVVSDLDPGASPHAAVTFDVTDDAAVARGVAEATELLGGRIDVLVNSAGILTEADVLDMSPETWRRTVEVDLTGVFLTCRHVVPGMVERRWGRIVNVASQLGIKGGRSLAHYSAAKAGVIGLTKSLALEVAPHGVLVNAIAPGPFETAMVAGLSDGWRAAKHAELPLGRFGVPAEVAPSALLLASEPAGNLYVGQVLGPNSGDVMP